MERELGDVAGGTLTVAEVMREHGEALEYDLIVLGLRLRDLGTPSLNWRDLWVICRNSGRTTRLYAALNPEDDPTWSTAEYLLAQVVDNTAWRTYQAAEGKGPKPKPVPRPGDVRRDQADTMPIEQMREWLESINGPR